MFADTAKLVVNLSLAGNFSKQMSGAQKALGKFDTAVARSSTRAYKAGTQIGTGIKAGLTIAAVGVGLLFAEVARGLNSLVTLEKATAQTEAVIKSTGAVAGITAVQVRNLAEKYEGLNATVGDEVIQSAENLLLTFTKVTKQGFEPALDAILNMNTALGKGPEGLAGTTTIVGKALQDPTKGLVALGRVGIKFTDVQQAQIKAALKSNDLFKAQGIIIAELNKRFGGSFLAEGGTTGGKVAKFKDSIEDLERTLATALLPTVSIIADKLTTFLQDPAVQQGAKDLGIAIAGLFNEDNIKTAGDVLTGLFKSAQEAAPIIADAAGTIGGFIGSAVSAFQSLPPELQSLAVAGLAINTLTGGLVTNIAGGLISAVISSFKGLMNVNAGVVNVNGPVAGVGGGVGGAAAAAGGGVVSTLAGVAIPVTIAAVSDQALFSLANTQNGTNFEPAGSGPFGIFGSLSAIQNGIDLLLRPPESPAQRALNDAVRNGDRSVIEAIKDQDNSVTVTTNVKTSDIYINGRLFQAGVARTQTIQSGRYAGKPLPTP